MIHLSRSCDSLVYYKVQWTVLTNCESFLLQSATRFITNCDRYYKVRWIYYKLRQVLQSAMIITNCDSTIGLNSDFFHLILMVHCLLTFHYANKYNILAF